MGSTHQPDFDRDPFFWHSDLMTNGLGVKLLFRQPTPLPTRAWEATKDPDGAAPPPKLARGPNIPFWHNPNSPGNITSTPRAQGPGAVLDPAAAEGRGREADQEALPAALHAVPPCSGPFCVPPARGGAIQSIPAVDL